MMERNGRTRKLLTEHCQMYPQMQILDVFKFLHQSSFGCEHLVSSLETATEYITKEYESVDCKGESAIVPLDGEYSRVPLSYLSQGLSVDTFGKLFVVSAKKEEHGLDDLQQKLNVATELVAEGLLPFQAKEWDQAVEEWKHKGYPAVHHSDVFRETYQPSYRVIANQYIPFLAFFAELDQRLANGKLVVALEGGSASGKTTLGNLLSGIYDCTVFHMDDFFLQPEQRTPERYAEIGGNVDRERFLTEVLRPLKEGKTINYRAFDCTTMRVGEEIQVQSKKLTSIEGAYSMHPELEEYYDFSIFLDISPELQKKRVLKRNSPPFAERFFEKWIPLETVYFTKTNIKQRCDMTISVT